MLLLSVVMIYKPYPDFTFSNVTLMNDDENLAPIIFNLTEQMDLILNFPLLSQTLLSSRES